MDKSFTKTDVSSLKC